jgi:hypothetical protein
MTVCRGRQELVAEGKEQYLDMPEFYTMKNVFFLPVERNGGLTAN